jgi:hypothetical protein
MSMHGLYRSLAYSALARFRIGVSPEQTLVTGALLFRFLQENHIGIGVPAQYAELLPVRRPVE